MPLPLIGWAALVIGGTVVTAIACSGDDSSTSSGSSNNCAEKERELANKRRQQQRDALKKRAQQAAREQCAELLQDNADALSALLESQCKASSSACEGDDFAAIFQRSPQGKALKQQETAAQSRLQALDEAVANIQRQP